MDRVQISAIGTICGAIVIFLCIYYDRYKRRDVNYKKKMLKKGLELQHFGSIDLKEIYDPKERQAYILHEIELAELFMSKNNVTDAIRHFVNAIAICEEPCNIIRALGQTLPPSAYQKLIDCLREEYGEKFKEMEQRLENEMRLMRLF